VNASVPVGNSSVVHRGTPVNAVEGKQISKVGEEIKSEIQDKIMPLTEMPVFTIFFLRQFILYPNNREG
jgi:hypothetical protein